MKAQIPVQDIVSKIPLSLCVLTLCALAMPSLAKTADLPQPNIVVSVKSLDELRAALRTAKPGTQINMAPGEYRGGLYFANLRGAAGKPIVIAATDPQRPPVFTGTGIQLSKVVHLELRNLQLRDIKGNGLNIDDGGTYDSPSHHVTLRNLKISNVGPSGNLDGIKLSGLDDFLIDNCRIERWGTGGGTGIDMVGCHRGLIENSTFIHEKEAAKTGASGIQAKGGCRNILIRRNRFEHAGQRAINIGGSTGFAYFRPPLTQWPQGEEKYEAKNIRVEGNTFIGSVAPLAFVGVDGAIARFNTIYEPDRWAMRILQETTAPGFVPSRNGVFTDNIVVFRANQWMEGGVNIGPNAQPQSFVFARNFWFNADAPTRSRPMLPVEEAEGVYGEDPLFENAPAGAMSLKQGSPAAKVGAEAWPIIEKSEIESKGEASRVSGDIE